MKLNEQSTEYLNSEHERLEENKDFHEWDEIMLEAIDIAQVKIMDILMERKKQKEMNEEIDHEIDDRSWFNDVLVGNISI